MDIQHIDLENYKRRSHFEHFQTMENPIVNLTAQVDITEWFQFIKEKEYPFFLSFLYVMTRAANRIPEFRQRIRNQGIIQYESCRSSYTVGMPDGTYRYCAVDADQPFDSYLAEAKKAQKAAMEQDGLVEDGDPESYYYVSNLPWIHYSALDLPFSDRNFSVPALTLGGYSKELKPVKVEDGIIFEERVLLPVSVQVNHALVDGYQIGQFYEYLREGLTAFCRKE